MRRALILTLLVLPLPAAAQKLDCANAMAQADLNECAAIEFEAADALLNEAYGAAMAAARRTSAVDPEAEDRLRAAQRAWVAFRDLACEAEAPAYPGAGSMQPMMFSSCLRNQTERRTEDLWLYVDLQGGP